MKEQHRYALKLAQDGFLILDKEPQKAAALFNEAFEIESEVANSYLNKKSEDDEPTRSILFNSAASLAKLSNKYSSMIEFARQGLAGNPPKELFEDLLKHLTNEEQHKFCVSEKDFIRLLAPAGSGKTTALLWRCLNLLQQGEKNLNFLLFTFTRVARDELRGRINSYPELAKLKGRIRIETLNQWGYNYIKNIKDGLQLKSSKQDFYFLINNNLRPLWDKKPFLSKLTSKTYVFKQVINIFSDLKTLGFSHSFSSEKVFFENFLTHFEWLKKSGLEFYFEEKIFEQIDELELLDYSKSDKFDKLKPFLAFWKKATDELWSQSIITLEDQKYWALRLLDNQYKDGKSFLAANRYHHILVDEFQDINPLDLMLINKLVAANKSTLSIIGDDDQAIYEWRGSSPKFIVKPEAFFENSFETFILNVNYRSPYNIVELSQKLITKNKIRVPKESIAFSKEKAKIEIQNYSTHVESLSFILDFIEKKSNEKIAIISRKKGQLIPLQILLTSGNISFYAKEDLNILLSQVFHELKKMLLIKVEKDQRKSSEIIVDEIMLCCNLIKKYPLSKSDSNPLRAYLKSQNLKTFTEGIILLEKYPNKIKSNDANIFSKAILALLNSISVSQTIYTIGEYFEGLQKHYVKSEDDIFYKEPPFLYLTDYAERYNNDFWSFIDHVDAAVAKMEVIYNEDQDSDDAEYKTNIHLMTALRAKGKEFDHVIILDTNDGLWPIKFAETEEQLEQERRLFYVAITRTKKSLTFMVVDEIHGQKVFMSPYLNEMGLDF